MTKIYAIAAAVVLGGLLGLMGVLTIGPRSDDKFAQCRASSVAGGTSAIGGPFTLVDETGATVTEKEVIDQPALLYFGYAFCPDICPMDSARNADAVALLESAGKIVKPVFISVDPARDTPELLADFTDNLHPRMLGLTGSPAQVKAASQAYKTYYQKQEPEAGDEDFYLMNHSTYSYLVLPEHGFVEFFNRDVSPRELADTISCFLDAQ